MDKASAPGAGDSRFKSWAGHSHELLLCLWFQAALSFLDKARERASAVVNQQNLANAKRLKTSLGLYGSTQTILSEILLGAGVSMPGRQLHAVCKFAPNGGNWASAPTSIAGTECGF